MQDNALLIEHPAGEIETTTRQDTVVRVGALAGLNICAGDWMIGCTFPTSVSITA